MAGWGLPEKYQRLLQESGGDPNAAMLQVDINRGAVPGNRSPWAEGMSPADAAELDRYAWGRQAGIGGLPVAAIYEGMKGIDQATGGRLLPAVGEALNIGNFGTALEQDETSSPASLRNLWAYARGAFGR